LVSQPLFNHIEATASKCAKNFIRYQALYAYKGSIPKMPTGKEYHLKNHPDPHPIEPDSERILRSRS